MYHECRHIFTSGKKCQSPALTDQPFCYFHSNTRKKPTPANQPYDPYTDPKEIVLALTPLEDPDAIQLALSEVVLALAANRIDPRRARILIYGLQVASLNHRHRTAIKEETLEKAIVRETHRHADGTLIGPEKQTPDAEEIQEQERPSLGRILLREVQEMHKRKAEEEARLKAEEAAKAAQQSFSFHIDQNPRSSSRHLSIRTKPSLHAKKPPEQGSPTQPIHWPISPSKSPTSPLAERLCPALTGLVPSKIRCLCAVGAPNGLILRSAHS